MLNLIPVPVDVRAVNPRVESGTWMQRYLMNVWLFHLLTSCIVWLGTPARCIAIAAPDLIEWVPMQTTWNPSRSLPAKVVAAWSWMRIVWRECDRFRPCLSSWSNWFSGLSVLGVCSFALSLPGLPLLERGRCPTVASCHVDVVSLLLLCLCSLPPEHDSDSVGVSQAVSVCCHQRLSVLPERDVVRSDHW